MLPVAILSVKPSCPSKPGELETVFNPIQQFCGHRMRNFLRFAEDDPEACSRFVQWLGSHRSRLVDHRQQRTKPNVHWY